MFLTLLPRSFGTYERSGGLSPWHSLCSRGGYDLHVPAFCDKYENEYQREKDMKAGKIALAALLILGLSLVPLHSAMAAKRLGLFFTQEELDIWRKRAVSGPYKSTGDVSKNSPGDWGRIVSNKNTFIANPSANRWNPDWGSGCIPRGDTTIANHHGQYFIRDAAFYALVTDDSKVARTVINELVTQSQLANADFSNRSRFCTKTDGHVNNVFGTHPYFTIAIQQTIFLVAFDYVKGFATAGERATIRKWLRDAADWMQPDMRKRYDDLWVNRWAENWTPTKSTGMSSKRPYYGGPELSSYSQHYNNRDVELIRYMGLVGIEQEVDYLKADAKQWFKDYMVASVYPAGYVGEFIRWISDLPDLGWSYSHQVVGALAAIADAFARSGDFSLYEFTTTKGVYGTEGKPSGWPGKNLQFVIHSLAKHSDGKFTRYGTDQESRLTSDYRISGYNPADGSKWRSNQDVYWSIVNLYYKDPYVKGAYMRTNPGMKGYWANPSDRDRHWMGQAIFPGVLFMFGQLEEKVSPYPLKGSDTVPPDSPKNLKLISK